MASSQGRATALLRLAAADTEALALQDIQALPPGAALAPVVVAIKEGRAKASAFLASYTALVRKTVASRVDGHLIAAVGNSGSGQRPGHRPAPEYWWNCVGSDDAKFVFDAGVSAEETSAQISFVWDPASHTYEVTDAADADSAAEIIELIFVEEPSEAVSGGSPAPVTRMTPSEQEAEVWRRYHTLIDLWTWAPGEDVPIGSFSSYRATPDEKRITIDLTVRKEVTARFYWSPDLRTAETPPETPTEMREAFLALFALPPALEELTSK